MAASSRKFKEAAAPRPRGRGAPRLASPQDSAAPSPALHRQEMLQDQWPTHRGDASVEQKWPIRRTVTLIALSCGGFWAGLAWGLTRLVH
jgi:hypothetical protein